ncbi:hypothetical protein D3C81_1238230 [compost metagenome]
MHNRLKFHLHRIITSDILFCNCQAGSIHYVDHQLCARQHGNIFRDIVLDSIDHPQ